MGSPSFHALEESDIEGAGMETSVPGAGANVLRVLPLPSDHLPVVLVDYSGAGESARRNFNKGNV